MRSYSVKENHICSADSKILLYKQTDILLLYYEDTVFMILYTVVNRHQSVGILWQCLSVENNRIEIFRSRRTFNMDIIFMDIDSFLRIKEVFKAFSISQKPSFWPLWYFSLLLEIYSSILGYKFIIFIKFQTKI